jgi:hypothetical protein
VPDTPLETLTVKLWELSLSANGRVALVLAVPTAVIMIAIAYRIVRR